MKVKITACSDRLFWYKDLVGLEVEVEKESQDVYWAREQNEYRCLNFILKKDCEVVVIQQQVE